MFVKLFVWKISTAKFCHRCLSLTTSQNKIYSTDDKFTGYANHSPCSRPPNVRIQREQDGRKLRIRDDLPPSATSSSKEDFYDNDEIGPNKFRNLKKNLFIDDRSNSFEQTCRNLINKRFSSITVKELVFLPLLAADVRRERYFVNTILLNWWTLLEANLNNVRYSELAKFTFLGLQKIDAATNGDLVKILGFDPIAKMSFLLFDKISLISPKTFNIVLCYLQLLTTKATEQEKKALNAKLSEAFKTFISNCIKGEGRYDHLYTDSLDQIAIRMTRLGVSNLDETSLEQLIQLFFSIFDEKRVNFFASLKYIENFDRMAYVCLNWGVDPNKYIDNFWSTWYEQVAKYYPLLPSRSGIMNTFILKHLLLVSLTFDQEKEFVKIYKPLWVDGMKINRIHLLKDKTKMTVGELQKKYNGQPELLDVNIVKEIIHLLEV